MNPYSSLCDDFGVYVYLNTKLDLPSGRETVFLSDKAVLADGPLSYDEIPLYRVQAADLIGTPYAYSPYLETLGIQELIDSLHSSTCCAARVPNLCPRIRTFWSGSENLAVVSPFLTGCRQPRTGLFVWCCRQRSMILQHSGLHRWIAVPACRNACFSEFSFVMLVPLTAGGLLSSTNQKLPPSTRVV